MSVIDTMPDMIVVSGMSGAGRSEAMHVFEDMGYYCVDNLPASLIAQLAETVGLKRGEDSSKLAVVCDAKARGYFKDVTLTLDALSSDGITSAIVFLDADDDKLIARYKSSRRRHPLCGDGATISHGIERERTLLREIRGRADYVIDTTDLLPADLRAKLSDLFASGEERSGLAVSVYSFGFKHGAPVDADLVIDVRFLPNPYYDPVMRTMTGLDDLVRDYVLYNSNTDAFLKRWFALLDCVMPGYVAEGKQQLAIAVGCTGGQHRSVAIAEATGDYLRTSGYRVSVAHRDLALAVRPDGELVNADPGADDEARP